MRINFITNPAFKHHAPEIRVGSVVMCNGLKAVVVDKDKSCTPYRISPWDPAIGAWWAEKQLIVLPERVCGWDEKGPMFEPMARPSPQSTWDQYPPRAGMVVECSYLSKTDLRLVLGAAGSWYSFDSNGVMWQQADTAKLKDLYLPRPDLMPQFVEGE